MMTAPGLTEEHIDIYTNGGRTYELRGVLHDREGYPLSYYFFIGTDKDNYRVDIRELWKEAGVKERLDWFENLISARRNGKFLETVAHELLVHFTALEKMITGRSNTRELSLN
jgi:hypothetical protein